MEVGVTFVEAAESETGREALMLTTRELSLNGKEARRDMEER